MKALRNRVTVVTGANGGLGKALVGELIGRNCKVIATDLQDDQLKEFEQIPNYLGFVKANIQNLDGCVKLYQGAKEISPRIDCLMNVAACGVWGKFQDVPLEESEKTIAVDLMAPIWLTKLFLPDFLKQNFGIIANVSSLLGYTGVGNLAAYCASKHGLKGFTESLYGDLQGTNVQVTTLYPAGMKTPIFSRNATAQKGEKTLMPPDYLLQDPKFVARDFLRGIERKEIHVYTRPYGLSLSLATKLVPANYFLPLLNKLADKYATTEKQ